MHAHDITVFTNSRFISLHQDNNSIVSKNLKVRIFGPIKHSCHVNEWPIHIKMLRFFGLKHLLSFS